MLPNRPYLIHKAVEPENLTKAGAASIDDLYMTHFAQYKYDGCNMLAIIRLNDDGNYEVHKFSRTGEPVLSMDHIDAKLIETFKGYAISHSAWVVFGEAWQEGRTQQQISGDFRRHSNSPGLTFVLFDHMTYADFYNGRCDSAYGLRYTGLTTAARRTGMHVAETFNPGSYGNGRALRDALLERKSVGFDGLIYRHENTPWVAGSGTGGGIIKDKPDYSFDLLVLGVTEGTRANKGKVGALTCRFKDGTTVDVGTGLTKQERESWWAVPSFIVGKIVQVEAMGFTANGNSLREPRFKGIRFDKEHSDF